MKSAIVTRVSDLETLVWYWHHPLYAAVLAGIVPLALVLQHICGGPFTGWNRDRRG